jgi:ABC-type multidrug transport system permease subunit
MDFIKPLELQKWLMQVLAGSPDIFVAISLLTISSLAAFFRMPMIATFFMIGLFLLMFSAYISSPLLVLMFILGGLLLGFVMAKIFGQ